MLVLSFAFLISQTMQQQPVFFDKFGKEVKLHPDSTRCSNPTLCNHLHPCQYCNNVLTPNGMKCRECLSVKNQPPKNLICCHFLQFAWCKFPDCRFSHDIHGGQCSKKGSCVFKHNDIMMPCHTCSKVFYHRGHNAGREIFCSNACVRFYSRRHGCDGDLMTPCDGDLLIPCHGPSNFSTEMTKHGHPECLKNPKKPMCIRCFARAFCELREEDQAKLFPPVVDTDGVPQKIKPQTYWHDDHGECLTLENWFEHPDLIPSDLCKNCLRTDQVKKHDGDSICARCVDELSRGCFKCSTDIQGPMNLARRLHPDLFDKTRVCSFHTCRFDGCKNAAGGYRSVNLCDLHKHRRCVVDYCQEIVSDENVRYCSKHKCRVSHEDGTLCNGTLVDCRVCPEHVAEHRCRSFWSEGHQCTHQVYKNGACISHYH